MLYDPLIRLICSPLNPRPSLRLIVTVIDETGLTTYTFTNAAVGLMGTARFGTHENVVTDTPLIASQTGRGIYCFIQGTDALATFNVSSVTIGGVAGTELVDRGGATNAVNSAIYGWSDTALVGITAWDVVVTWSEVITACAIQILEVSNLRSFGAIATGSATSTGAIAVDVTGVADNERLAGGGIVLVNSMATGTVADPTWDFTPAGAGPMDAFFPQQIFAGQATSLSQALAYFIIPSINGHGGASILNFTVDWPGTVASDATAVYLG